MVDESVIDIVGGRYASAVPNISEPFHKASQDIRFKSRQWTLLCPIPPVSLAALEQTHNFLGIEEINSRPTVQRHGTASLYARVLMLAERSVFCKCFLFSSLILSAECLSEAGTLVKICEKCRATC
jgi:hypothetical protein